MTEPNINPNYAAFQIAKAITARKKGDDPGRAEKKIAQWESVLRSILSGSVDFGSRTPVEGVPEWVTLEVVTGGFATGELLAGGPLKEHEKKLLSKMDDVPKGQERRILNAYFLTEPGITDLHHLLKTGCYEVEAPEEGALLVVAWLVNNGCADTARELLETLSPYFSRLRFYPIPAEQPRRGGARVRLQDVGKTIEDLKRIRRNQRVLAQKEAIEIWIPFYDRIVAMFLETMDGDWPCQRYPADWSDRALALLDQYSQLKQEHTLCSKMEQKNKHPAQLKEFLRRCAKAPMKLKGKEVGRIRLILKQYLAKRGEPDSEECSEARRRQRQEVSAPLHYHMAKIVISRLEKYPRNKGLDDISGLIAPEDAPIPLSIQRKTERCLNETVEHLVKRGLITSGETLAKVLPQMTSEIRAQGVTDPDLRSLYAAIYRAFRRRRSLLLLDLEKQIQIEELPWLSVIESFRTDNLATRELSRRTLQDVTMLTLASFPHVLLPNKLLQELRALVKGAGLNIPLVDELATDIFMGQFSEKFVEAFRIAGDLLNQTLYATYYGINYDAICCSSENQFAKLCSSRAGVDIGTWNPASNGKIIEQQQILTTQNLAPLFKGLGLNDTLGPQLGPMAKNCFQWVCRRLQVKVTDFHSQLIQIKNTAYAWRQMIFYLSLLPNHGVGDFLLWAKDQLDEQGENFRVRFRPAFNGLALAVEGQSMDNDPSAQRFTGWTTSKHWLMTDLP